MQLKLEYVELSKTRDGETIAVLRLIEPIKEVISSLSKTPFNRYKPLIATDVVEVLVHESMMGEIEYDENTQTITTELEVDVSKTGRVWLTDKLFIYY